MPDQTQAFGRLRNPTLERVRCCLRTVLSSAAPGLSPSRLLLAPQHAAKSERMHCTMLHVLLQTGIHSCGVALVLAQGSVSHTSPSARSWLLAPFRPRWAQTEVAAATERSWEGAEAVSEAVSEAAPPVECLKWPKPASSMRPRYEHLDRPAVFLGVSHTANLLIGVDALFDSLGRGTKYGRRCRAGPTRSSLREMILFSFPSHSFHMSLLPQRSFLRDEKLRE